MAEPISAGRAERVGVVVVHGVGETEPGWINASLVPQLEKHAGRRIAFAPYSEVHSLRDAGRRRPDARFNAYVRHGWFTNGPEFALIECFWADLSKIGTGPLSNFISLMRLFYEAPQVLGHASLARATDGAVAVVRWLTLFANWLLRWPITGLNTAALFCAIVMLARGKLIEAPKLGAYIPDYHLAIPVGIVLAALAGLSFYVAVRQEHRDITVSDIAKSTALFSVILLALTAVGASVYPAATASKIDYYLAVAALMIFAFWFFWNHAVLAAILILAGLYVRRLFLRGDAKGAPLVRPAAALALATIQGVIWKIVVALPWLLLLLALAPESFNAKLPCADEQFYDANCILKDINGDLFNVIVFNFFMTVALAAAFLAVASWRAVVRTAKRKSATNVDIRQPRLIVSPAIIALMFAFTLFNFYSFYALVYRDALSQYLDIDLWLPFEPYKIVEENVIRLPDVIEAIQYIGAVAAIFVVLRIFRAAQHASRGLLHIARDIVDHQYTPRTAAARLWRAVTPKSKVSHPRRDRIEHRLDSLMREVVTAKKFDRLVFVSHSQGTVILYDYLVSGRDNASIQGVKWIDVVTLGSPLTHLYRYYFDDYDKVVAPGLLHDRLASWTNLWRIDDPIGQKVDMFVDGFTKNEVLPKGGHVDYWREPRVCKIVLDLIDPSRASEEPARTEPATEAA